MDEPRWLDETEMGAWRALVEGANLLFDRLSDDLEVAHGLSLAEYGTLVHLDEACAGLRMRDLAMKALASKSRMTHMCDRLERDGLVERIPDEHDRRGLTARITEAGRSKLAEAAPTHVAGVRRYLVDRLTTDELRHLSSALNKTMDALDS